MANGWDASELEHYENEVLLKAAIEAHLGSSDVVKDQALRFRNDWRDNARQSAGAHGKHYPSSITAEKVGDAAWEIGPDSALPQGGMGAGFEWGSVNQPPHNDMGQAIVAVPERLESAVKQWSEKLL
ncbi:hypothetical protein [Nonomuraea sp. NPDC050643]|uniref:hypothetical protein n=1 Tax=Nonomuraea sp. NPDC050643 TaxID=3155660 RepID=UPI0033C6D3A4